MKSPRRGKRRLAAIVFGVGLGTCAAHAQTPQTGGDAAAGENLFYDRCAMCHIAEGGGQGPSLEGLYGRRAASVPGFAYSDALKASGLTWNGPNLDRFLADPRAMVPGTAMPILVADPAQRADLIAWFASRR